MIASQISILDSYHLSQIIQNFYETQYKKSETELYPSFFNCFYTTIICNITHSRNETAIDRYFSLDELSKPVQHVLMSFFSRFDSIFVFNLVPNCPPVGNSGKDFDEEIHLKISISEKQESKSFNMKITGKFFSWYSLSCLFYLRFG